MSEIINYELPNSISYNKTQFETATIGTSDCNMFIPLYASYFCDVIQFPSGDRILQYAKPINAIGGSRRYVDMFYHLKVGIFSTSFYFRKAGIQYEVYYNRGIVYDADHIYLCLAVNTEYLLNTDPEEIKSNPDPRKHLLFINNAIYAEHLTNVRRKLENEYIDVAKSEGIDIIYTNRLEEWLYSNNYETPTFSTIDDLNKHLKEEIPVLLFEE